MEQKRRREYIPESRLTFRDVNGDLISMSRSRAEEVISQLEDTAKQKLQDEYLNPIAPRDPEILQQRAEWLKNELNSGRTHLDIWRGIVSLRRLRDRLTQWVGDGTISFYHPNGEPDLLPEEEFKALLPEMDEEARQLIQTVLIAAVREKEPQSVQKWEEHYRSEVIQGLSHFERWMAALRYRLPKD